MTDIRLEVSKKRREIRDDLRRIENAVNQTRMTEEEGLKRVRRLEEQMGVLEKDIENIERARPLVGGVAK